MKYLTRRVGSTVNQTVMNMLRSLMTESLISEYSRDGKKDKRSLAAVPGGFVAIVTGNYYLFELWIYIVKEV